MDYSEKYGNSIDEAVDLALKDLKVSRDDVNIQVLEEPSKGFLGLGSKLAKVRVELKEKQPEPEPEKTQEKPVERPQRQEKHESAARNKRNNRKDRNRNKERKPRKPRKPIVESRPADLQPVEEHEAISFLKSTTESMGLDLEFKAMMNDENIYIDISGEDAGTIIGKRGQTLDAIQYLTSLVINKESDKYMRVVLDAENYRSKRERTLEQLADRLAGKVAKTRRSVRLEPMNPYERMVIHATLQDDDRVVTRSEGEEPYRRVVIELKK
ncbi:MAG: RNA-binding cell elongation regulator Jag/EloR [Anaerovoracaceae bacterium]|jgi:spoIIIJ-associated protein